MNEFISRLELAEARIDELRLKMDSILAMAKNYGCGNRNCCDGDNTLVISKGKSGLEACPFSVNQPAGMVALCIHEATDNVQRATARLAEIRAINRQPAVAV